MSEAAEAADWEVQRDEAKAAGDAAFRSKDFSQAIENYTLALSVDPDNAKILSNRSAAFLAKNEKSKSLHDAQKCVEIGTMGNKGLSRLAAALQSLGRWEAAMNEWKKILKTEASHNAALKGFSDCDAALKAQRQKEEQEEEPEPKTEETTKGDDENDDEGDDLDDFFNDVDEATEAVVKQKQEEAKPKPTEAIKHHKKDLGTADEQIERLLAPNYKWRNLNPFFVLDIPHSATEDDLSKRYKALSLLLHPDKNRGNPKAQEAFDEVLKAKAQLKEESKANYIRQLAEEGMKQGKEDWEGADQQQKRDSNLEEFQSKAVHRIFAQFELRRKEAEDLRRKNEQKIQENEDAEEKKERDSRKRDKSWRQEERVDKRIGNWRDFQKKKKTKS